MKKDTAAKKTEGDSFEQGFEKLSRITGALNAGGLPLSEALSLYKDAVSTIKTMSEELENAEGRVIIMKREMDGALSGEAFDVSDRL